MLFIHQGNFLCSKDFSSSAENQKKTNNLAEKERVAVKDAPPAAGRQHWVICAPSAAQNFTPDALELAQKHGVFTFLSITPPRLHHWA